MADIFEVGLTGDFLSEGKLLFRDIGLHLLDEVDGVRHRFLESRDAELSPELLEGLDVLLCLAPRVTAHSLGRAERLLAVVRFGVGYDNVDVPACTKAGVPLFISLGAVDYSVAEAILAWMLALGHRVPLKDRLVREGRWKEKLHWMGSELRHKVVGIVGLGGIGSALVELLRPFRISEVVAFDPYVSREKAARLQVRLTGLAEMLRASDYVAVCCPLNEETRGLLGRTEFALMKPGVYLINTARGGIVDEAALADALRSEHLGGAAIDVFAQEPANADHPLSSLDNVILAPHAIAWTHEIFAEIGETSCRQIINLFHGRIPEGLVNKEVCDHPILIQKLQRRQRRTA